MGLNHFFEITGLYVLYDYRKVTEPDFCKNLHPEIIQCQRMTLLGLFFNMVLTIVFMFDPSYLKEVLSNHPC